MIDEFAKKIVYLHTKVPKIVILVFLLVNLAMIPGIISLVDNVEPSLERVLPQDIPEIQTLNYLRGEYGSDMLYLLVKTQDSTLDVRDPTYLEYIEIVSNKIETREHVLRVTSLADFTKDNGELANTQSHVEEILEDEKMHKNYVDDDYSFSIIEVQTNMGSSAQAISEVIDAIRLDIENTQEYNPGTITQVTGFGAIDRATFSVIMSDFLVITFVSMGLIAVIVYFTFGSFARGMLPMSIVMNALIWTMGIAGYLQLTITVVSMVAAAMIMGLGIDFGIHQVHGYFRLREEEGKSAKKAITEVVQELLRAMIGASLTTIAGFLALLFGSLPAMKTLGIILAMGIFNTLIGAVFLLPAIIYLSDKNKTYKQKEVKKQ